MFRLSRFAMWLCGFFLLASVSRPLFTAVHGRLGALAGGSIPAGGGPLLMKEKSSKVCPPAKNDYGKLPIYFEPNLGQTDSHVKFIARGSGATTFLTATEAVFSLPVARHSRESGNPDFLPTPTNQEVTQMSISGIRRLTRGIGLGVMDSSPRSREFQSPQSPIGNRQSVIRMKLVGADPKAQIEGLDRLPGISNYFIGNDPKKWRTNIPHYAKVRYCEVYPGIDLVYYSNRQSMEYD
ncbi:MAG: hypothetical protein ACRD2L_23175, partial [Terriglobia bacterium]